MTRRLAFGLLPVALGLLMSACADQGSFEPTATDEPSLTPSVTRVEPLGGKRGPGGSVGGLKKGH
jgi:hypothetical protein